DQLRQTARTLSPNSENAARGASATNRSHRFYPCAEITNACRAAGFVHGGAPGTGIGKDCIAPIVDGTPQTPNAPIPLPKVSPDVVVRCKAVNPNYGHFDKGAASGTEDRGPDSDPE